MARSQQLRLGDGRVVQLDAHIRVLFTTWRMASLSVRLTGPSWPEAAPAQRAGGRSEEVSACGCASWSFLSSSSGATRVKGTGSGGG